MPFSKLYAPKFILCVMRRCFTNIFLFAITADLYHDMPHPGNIILNALYQ